MRRPVGRLAFQRPIQNPRLQSRGQLARALPGMAAEQPRQSLPPKPLAPAADKRIVAAQFVPDLRPGMARLQQQDQPCPTPIVTPDHSGSPPADTVPDVPLPSVRSYSS